MVRSSENNLFSIAEQNRITILEYFDNKLDLLVG